MSIPRNLSLLASDVDANGVLSVVGGGTGSTTSTGSGAVVLATSPTLVTPLLGTPTSGNFSTGTFTWPTFNQSTTGSAATLTTGRTIAITGDLTYTSPSFNGSAAVTAAGTLATVNANIGSYTNASITVNAKGLVTAASSGTTLNGVVIGGTTAAAGSFTTLAASSTVTATGIVSGSELTSSNSTGDEGGQINLAKPVTNTTLGGGVTIDVYQNKLRIFEQGGTARGVYIDLTAAAAGVATNLVASGGTGTVTSVGGTGTVSGLTLTGTVTTTGNLTLGGTLAVTASNFASQTANTILAAPTGTAGVPTFRAIVAADIPTLNQNTTGTAANVTGTVAFANGGTGATARQDAMDALAGATTSGSYLRGNGTDVVMSTIQAADVPTLNQNTTGSSGSTTGSAATFTSTTQNSQFNSIGVGTAASATAGEIRATNNVTAYYSDDRFKTKLGNIPNALAKVKTLNGFYYEANELAQSYGYEKKLEVGVSAQQVQAILPEVVAPAPIDENYLTVRYERLVPLLIEAIKELEARVALLESK